MKDAPEVRLPAGTLRGARESAVAVFRGIPYAAPPVGADRFAAPRPPDRWAGVREATAFGPSAPQTDVFGSGSAAGPAGDGWLTVNVWSPSPGPGARLPVLVWIHGGGYTVGRSSSPEYDGGRLAREGPVVLVTFNYRLGVEGFAHIDGAPANRGLLDQVAALEWVRDNIGAFGGDPARVTVFGESAGGGSVAALLAMPRASGLFRAAVAQSVPGTFFSPAFAAGIAAALAAEVGPRFADVDPARLAAAADRVTAGFRSIRFSPVVDGEVLPTTPWEAVGDRDIPLLTGHTRDEYRLFTVLNGGPATTCAVEQLAPGGARSYPESFPDAGPELLDELVQSDWLFRMPSLHLAEARVAGGGRAFLYELTWPAPGLGGALGACHGLDVPLVFGNLTSGQTAVLLGDRPGDDAIELSAQMRAAWIAFATDGDPGWPAYSAEQRLTRIFDIPGSVTAYPEELSRLIWQSHSFEAR
ncbi:carboxylesterase family protein [Paractinoplanes ferrugineus]|uniref:Carboxylic ester hydrolase n=1 Tax=Paractinoplanes ferrugineus TaxID=113564 RepID=A0A919IYS1_9ACTN|nr:carboxylesterase family protein [Actinoplanes ferrugineus]GIE10377.1 carboxylic ester hydrolase [Actinoplanes ferrugineus]